MFVNIIPNILSSFRIIAAPFLLIFAWEGSRSLFIGLLIATLLSDSIDGFVARRLGTSSNLGAKLDSFGDMVIYLTVPLCAWWLWPQILREEALFVFIVIGAYILPLLAGFMKFRRIPSYHTLGAKTAAVIMSIAVLTLFITEFTLLFRVAAVFQAIVACEEIFITIQLPVLQSNVKSILHVRRDYIQNRT